MIRSPAGLTRGSIEQKGFFGRGWIAGSSLATTAVNTAWVGLRRLLPANLLELSRSDTEERPMTLANVERTKRGAKQAPQGAAKQSRQDLRVWLDQLRAAGEVQEISGAEREAEIGGIVDLYMRKMGNPAVLFDEIPGYPRGHRILAN